MCIRLPLATDTVATLAEATRAALPCKLPRDPDRTFIAVDFASLQHHIHIIGSCHHQCKCRKTQRGFDKKAGNKRSGIEQTNGPLRQSGVDSVLQFTQRLFGMPGKRLGSSDCTASSSAICSSLQCSYCASAGRSPPRRELCSFSGHPTPFGSLPCAFLLSYHNSYCCLPHRCKTRLTCLLLFLSCTFSRCFSTLPDAQGIACLLLLMRKELLVNNNPSKGRLYLPTSS